MVLFTATELVWRWSQLAITIVILVVEFCVRNVLSLFCKVVPVSYLWGLVSIPKMLLRLSEEELNMEKDAAALISSKGYPVEEYFATTADGFVLGLQRIPHGAHEAHGAHDVNQAHLERKGMHEAHEMQGTRDGAHEQRASAHEVHNLHSVSELPDGAGSDDEENLKLRAHRDQNVRASACSQQQQQQEGSHDARAFSAQQQQQQQQQPLPRANNSKKVVLIIHGMMQSSEAFLARKSAKDSLPFVLADAGYDVWLGNNRGNKYSYKHTKYSPKDEKFWDWSLDEMIAHDLPAMIETVLYWSGADTLTLIGFSQGTAQSWAALSINPELSKRVNLFIALAPVATVKGFSSPLVDALARSRPDFIFLLFGRKQILPVTLFWRKILGHVYFAKMIDASVYFLFGWTGDCIDPAEKSLVYSYIYSYSSVKNTVHWFQIIQSDRFQMFDDVGFQNSYPYSAYHIPAYTPSRLTCKVACFYGGRDNLPNTAALLKQIPKHNLVHVHKEDRYEHLDFMWAKDIRKKIYPTILNLLEEHAKV